MSYKNIIDDVREAVKNNFSYAGVLRALGKNPYSSGSQGCLKRFIVQSGIDNAHFTGQIHGKPKPKKKWSESSANISTHVLKNRMWRDGILQKKCNNCGLEKWNEIEAPLQLHHRDGNRTNNDISNLEILCANCHAQTDTYCRRKKRPP